MDTVPKQKRRERMSGGRNKDSAMERIFRGELHRRGFHYRKNVSGLLGRPDIVFKSRRVVIFLDSCFWHGCRWHCRIPCTNRAYWTAKIEGNKKRDKEVTTFYKKENGWRIVRVWEHEAKE